MRASSFARSSLVLSALLLGASRARGAAPDAVELARRAENPVEPMVSVPIQENLDYGLGPNDRAQSLLKLEPVFPVRLSAGWNLVTRTIVPFEYKPDTSATTGGSSGLGDINPTFFLSPAPTGAFRWGAGPDLELPTATQTSIGAGRWSVGPSMAFVAQPRPWTFGAIASNVWSVAGESGRAGVNKLSLELFVHFNFASGWILTTSPTLTANWKAARGDVWQIPVGGGAGHVYDLGATAIHATVQAYGYAATPSGGPTWELRVQATVLFPE